MPITDEVLRILLEGDKHSLPTRRVALNITKTLLTHLQKRMDLELESTANTAVAIDFDGDLGAVDRYRAAIGKTRLRLEKWRIHEEALIEEGL
jgi:hypothetical protein